MQKPDEPLELSAPLARQLAEKLCRKDPVTGQNCSWYHGLWQDLRMLGLATSPAQQRKFFLQSFKALAARRRLRVLISGAADYSILAHAIWAANAGGLNTAITVVDVCDTPLFLNRWYAERVRHPITTVRADIFRYQPEKQFDVICSHAFLGQIPPRHRARLVQTWSNLLNPKGTVLMVNRVRPADTAEEVKFSSDQARAFCATARHRIRQSPSLTAADGAEILDRARVYVKRMHVYAVSRVELLRLFQRAGFRVDPNSAVSCPTNDGNDLAGPAVPSNSEHLCLMASWRASSGLVSA